MKKQETTVEAAALTFLQKLHNAKQSIKKVAKNAKNPHFKNNYADINALIEEVEPILLENRLLLLQPIEDGYVYTRIVDIDSAEICESCMKLPEIQDPQKIGSAVTYYRRYTLQSLLSLQAVDDDANTASQAINPNRQPLNDERFTKALDAVKNGLVRRDKLINDFALTNEQVKKLLEL
jgi:hypothetical protein